MGWRPLGSSARVETSKSPNTVIATVRGIGVALIAKKCGECSPEAARAMRCSTPKRCCSSTIATPRLFNRSPFVTKAWVPTTKSGSPASSRVLSSAFSFAGVEPVNKNRESPSLAPKSCPSVAKCCVARTSVGAISAAWCPLSKALTPARAAITVFPEPTSPCSRRFIGVSFAMSPEISCQALT